MEGQEHLTNDEDVEAILRLAVNRQGQDTETLRQRLEASAAELGISPEALQKAEEDYRAVKASEQEAVRAREEARQARRRRIRGLAAHWIPFLAVNVLLHVINFALSPQTYWALWPLMGWGIGMFSHTWSVLTCDEKDLKELEKEDRLQRARRFRRTIARSEDH